MMTAGKMKLLLAFSLAFCLGFIAIPHPARAVDRYVSPSGDDDANAPYTSWASAAKTISAAVEACSSNDTVWVTNGTYVLSSAINITETIRLISVNGPEYTTIDGNDSCQCIVINNAAGSSVEGFSIVNARNSNFGGAIFAYCGNGDSMVSNCVISGNIEQSSHSDRGGGGILMYSGGKLIDCVISNNTANLRGGGVFCLEGGKIINCVITNNIAGSGGGGVYYKSGGEAFDSLIAGNTVTNGNGGGVYFDSGGLASNCTITANSIETNYSGGGVYFNGAGGKLYNSSLTENTGAGKGAGIYFKNGGMAYSCGVSNHTAAEYGGGIYIEQSGTISDSTVSENQSGFDGAGAYMDNGGMILNCVISANQGNNTYQTSGFGGGGGVYILNSGCVSNTVIEYNSVTNVSDGGGIYCSGGGTILDSQILNNSSPEGYGGGALIETSATFDRCIINGNEALSFPGGGIFSDGGGIIQNCVISRNRTGDSGGGAYANGGTYRNCTIVDNEAINFASIGGGIYADSGSLENCIMYYNSSDMNSNYKTNSTATIINSCSTPLPSGTGNISDSPDFIDFPYSYHLSSNSPCIDDGVNGGWMTLDVDGHPRISGGTVDMGADEFIPVPDGFNAEAGGPYSGAEEDEIALDASSSVKNSDDPLLYRWDFGDGASPSKWNSSSTISHTYGSAGDFTVTLLILNNEALDIDTTTVSITNLPPLVSAEGPYSGYAREPVTVTPTGEETGPTEALEYRFDFGDGWTSWSRQTNGTHTYNSQCETNFTVQVREVLDEFSQIYGLTNSDTGSITVDQGLTAIINPVSPAGEGMLASFSGSKTGGSSDSLLYRWRPGDGSGWSTWSSSNNRQHIYDDDSGAGTYTVSCQVSNTYTWSETNAPVTITNIPPLVTNIVFTPSDVWLFEDVTAKAHIMDPGANDTAMYNFRFENSWSGWTSNDQMTHSYTNAGLRTVSVMAADNDGGTSTVAQTTLNIIVAKAASTEYLTRQDLQMNWNVVSNQSYTLQRSLSLTNPNWLNITSVITPESNTVSFIETNTFPKAYYRIKLEP